MSANSKKTTTKGKRYTDAEKQEVISFVGKVNAEKGRGGQAAAADKYNISVMTVASWLKAGAALKPAKATTAAVKPATAATVAAKPAKATKGAAKPAKKSGVTAAIPPVSVKPVRPAKAFKALPVKSGLSATAIVALGSQIAKAEAELAVLKAMIRTLK